MEVGVHMQVAKQWLQKGWASLLILCFLVTLAPSEWISQVDAATSDLEVYVGGARIGNASYEAHNAVVNFQLGTSGFTKSEDGDVTANFGDGDIYLFKDDSITMTIRVQHNPLLQELASSGHAQVEFGWDKLVTVEEGGSWGGIEKDHQKTSGKIYIYTEDEAYNPFAPTLADSSGTSSAGSKSGSHH